MSWWTEPPAGALWVVILVSLASLGFAIAAFSMALVVIAGRR